MPAYIVAEANALDQEGQVKASSRQGAFHAR